MRRKVGYIYSWSVVVGVLTLRVTINNYNSTIAESAARSEVFGGSIFQMILFRRT
jgi:hypothetical protein